MSGDEKDVAPLLSLTGRIVAAYVRKNAVPASAMPAMISSVHTTLKELAAGTSSETGAAPKPAVPVKKSVTPEYLVCLEDGKRLKMLKRYLRSRFDLSPEEYRAKWHLPPDYPMVTAEYAARRSAFAKKMGLGRTRFAAGKRRKRGG